MIKVVIRPDGDAKGPETFVEFQSKDEQEAYIRQEYRFCRKEEQAYLAAFTKNDRARTQKELLLKRVEFARTQGFTKSDFDGVWRRAA